MAPRPLRRRTRSGSARLGPRSGGGRAGRWTKDHLVARPLGAWRGASDGTAAGATGKGRSEGRGSLGSAGFRRSADDRAPGSERRLSALHRSVRNPPHCSGHVANPESHWRTFGVSMAVKDPAARAPQDLAVRRGGDASSSRRSVANSAGCSWLCKGAASGPRPCAPAAAGGVRVGDEGGVVAGAHGGRSFRHRPRQRPRRRCPSPRVLVGVGDRTEQSTLR